MRVFTLNSIVTVLCGVLFYSNHASSFIIIPPRGPSHPSKPNLGVAHQTTTPDEEDVMAIRAPLRMLGPYPVISLRFPNMETPAQLLEQQKETGETGVALDFVVDTAANVNTINAKLAATDLKLPQVGVQAPGISTGGALGGGATYLLGDCELNDIPQAERVLFLSGLTASALPVASPSGAGLLGVGFLFAFPGGVEFCWGTKADAEDVKPSLTFFGDLIGTDGLNAGLCEVPCRQLESGLVCVTMRINGVEIPSLLDTGSPITVLNAAAATAAGIVMPGSENDPDENKLNPFAKAARMAKEAIEDAQLMASGEVALIGGENGPIPLRKIPEKAPIALGDAELGSGRPYVGDIPSLALLDGLGAGAGPAAILGTDVLRQRTKLLLRDGKVYV